MTVSTRFLVYLVSALMFSTAVVYFLAAYLESDNVSDHGAQIEIMLFSVVGIAHIPLGVWMLKNRLSSMAPYVISIIISVALIGLYGAAKITILPIVGLESSVGTIDLTSKVLQIGIIVISAMVMPELKRNQNFRKLCDGC